MLIFLLQLQLFWYWLNGMDYSRQYKMLERRRVFIKFMVEERRKLVAGMAYNRPLLLAAEKYLEVTPKPRFTVYAESEPVAKNPASITKKYRDANKYDEAWPEIHDSYYV